MTEQVTVAEEYYAKQIAFWHGQKMLYRSPEGRMITVADARGIPWEWEGVWMDKYVDRHWREYVAAARVIIHLRD